MFRGSWQVTKEIRGEFNMRLRFGYFAFSAVLALGIAGCGGTSEPSEAQMKDAMEYALNHPPGVKNSDPIKISFFKKEACDNPTPQGYRCTFTVTVTSANAFAQMYNNVTSSFFYKDKDSGKWAMRPPF
jgi:hypothetical protein